MKYTVVLIGVGALGKRHLSSVLNSKLELEVFCYDINLKALEDFEWEDDYNNKSLKVVTDMTDIPQVVDFAIIATSSNVRREMFEKLVNHRTIKGLLLEKVLFQTIEDYHFVEKKIKELGIKAWVNCARRQMDCYQNLKKELESANEMHILFSGGEWGLACNAIHKIDLVEFLSGSKDTCINNMALLPDIVNSKRSGFKEIYGAIYGNSGKVKNFIIECMKSTNTPEMIVISSDIGQYVIFENQKKIITVKKSDDYQMKEMHFDVLYQSQMTQYVMESVLLSGESKLTPFCDSVRLHLSFVTPLIQFFKESGMEEGICPIT